MYVSRLPEPALASSRTRGVSAMKMQTNPVVALAFAVAVATSACAPFAFAADRPGSRDHPLVGRFAGSEIVQYAQSDFDEVALLRAPHDFDALLERNAFSDRSGNEWLVVGGRITRIRYEVPAGHTSLEVLRNYRQALTTKGFVDVYECADHACLAGLTRDPYAIGWQLDTLTEKPMNYFDHARWRLAKTDREGRAVYAGVLAGERDSETTVYVVVVESAPMASGRIVHLDASQLDDALKRSGRVDVYGIEFDFDSDRLRPESTRTLEEIGKLLHDRPELRLDVVGHTDDSGTAAYNRDLSLRRARSVVRALLEHHGVAPDRLRASGMGDTQPVADNATDEGRAKNRRVALIRAK